MLGILLLPGAVSRGMAWYSTFEIGALWDRRLVGSAPYGIGALWDWRLMELAPFGTGALWNLAPFGSCALRLPDPELRERVLDSSIR